MTHDRKRLYLIDGNSYIYRAFHAIRNLSNSRGFPTNAIYGFATMLLKIVREEKPTISAWPSTARGRHPPRVLPAYKATRHRCPRAGAADPDHLGPRAGLPDSGHPAAGDRGRRPARRAAREGLKHQLDVVLVSGDKTCSSSSARTSWLLDTMKAQRWTPEEVEKRYGIGPEAWST